MAGRSGNVRVSITADTSGLGRGTRQAEKDIDRLSHRGSASLGALRVAAKGAGVAVGAGLALSVREAAKAAIEAEKSQARLQAQLKASGLSFKQHAKAIEEAIQKTSQLSGLDDEDLQDSFTNIVRVTGDVNKALKLNGIAADFARAKHIDVAKAGEIVGKVAGGNTGILSRYGIQIKKGATEAEALAALQKKFAGQAEAYGKTTAGSMDRMKVAGENLAETVGTALTPTIATAANGIARFVTQMQTGTGAGGAFVSRVREITGDVKRFVTSTQGMAAIGAVIGGLTTRFVALRTAMAVSAVMSWVSGIRAAGGAMAALNAVVARNPLGMLATVAGTVAGALAGLHLAQNRAKTSSNDLADAIDNQRDALRQLRDLDIQAAQAKANLKTANLGVEQAERNLSAARKQFGRNSIQARQAEADLAQARVQQKRATREAGDVESNANKTRRDARRATQDLVNTSQGRVDTLKAEVREIGRDIIAKDDDARNTQRLKEKMAELNAELRKLKSRKIRIQIETWSSVKGAREGGSFRGGGSVPIMAAGGEMGVLPNGSTFMIPGDPRSDSTPLSVPSGTAIFTGHGQQLLASGAGPGEALRRQRPHFAKGGRVSAADATRYARKHGFPSAAAVIAGAVTVPESSGNPFARRVSSVEDSRGLWQINTKAHPWSRSMNLYDPDVNARAANRVWRGRGRSFQPWAGFTSGAYRRYLGAASAGLRGAVTGITGGASVGGGTTSRFVRAKTTFPRLAGMLSGLVGGVDRGFEAGVAGDRLGGDFLNEIIGAVKPHTDDFGRTVTKDNPRQPIRSLREAAGGVPSGTGNRAYEAMRSFAGRAHAKGLMYKYGGGHGRVPNGGPWDCSSFVSSVLAAGGLMSSSLDTTRFKNWGQPGPGKLVTIGVKGGAGPTGHMMMKLGNAYYEASSGRRTGRRSGWSSHFPVKRHPKGMRSGGAIGGWTPLSSLTTYGSRDTAGAGEALRALASLVGNNRVSFSALSAGVGGIRGAIRKMMRNGLTGRERVVTRRLRGALSIFQGEQGRRLGAPIASSQGVMESISTAAGRLPNQLILRGIDPESQEGVRVQNVADVTALNRLRARRKSLGTALKRAKRIGNKTAIKSLTAELGTNAAAIEGTRAGILTRDQAFAASQPTGIGQLDSVISDIDLRERAGVYTKEQAAAAREQARQFTLGGGFGALSERESLQIQGDLKEAIEANTAAQEEAAKAQAERDQAQAERDQVQARIAELLGQQVANQNQLISLTQTQGPQLMAAFAAVVSGDLGGRIGLGFQTPGVAGSLARY